MYSTSYDDTFLFFASFQAIFVELGLSPGCFAGRRMREQNGDGGECE